MEIREFPLCCTAKIIVDFGGTHTSGGQTSKISREDLDRDLKYNIRFYGRYALIVMLNSDQKVAHKVLKDNGFEQGSPYMPKLEHSENKLKLYFRRPNV